LILQIYFFGAAAFFGDLGAADFAFLTGAALGLGAARGFFSTGFFGDAGAFFVADFFGAAFLATFGFAGDFVLGFFAADPSTGAEAADESSAAFLFGAAFFAGDFDFDGDFGALAAGLPLFASPSFAGFFAAAFFTFAASL